jgi:hypothetical protein
MKSPGQSNDSNKLNFGLWINGTQVSWNSSANDDADGDTTDNPTYGRGSMGYYVAPVSAGQTLNIQVQCYNSHGTNNYWGEAQVLAFLCPWITPMQDYTPAAFSFAQDSTFYALLEPLYQNVSMTSKLGKKRFMSFGDATDYYSEASGSGILEHTYQFDVVDVPSSVWVVSCTGYIVCISYVGVDAR